MYWQSEKDMLNNNTSPTCPHNMVNFGLLTVTAEICWWVRGTPANFNGFCILAVLRHGTLVVGISQTAALNRGRHLYSAGRPSHWALAHILVALYTANMYSAKCKMSVSACTRSKASFSSKYSFSVAVSKCCSHFKIKWTAEFCFLWAWKTEHFATTTATTTVHHWPVSNSSYTISY